MTQLVTLDEMKTYLGIDLLNIDHDDFLNREITTISDAIEGYCNRKFLLNTYTQTFYADDYPSYTERKELHLFHYPISVINTIKEIYVSSAGNTEDLVTDYRLHKDSARLQKQDEGRRENWFGSYDKIEINYDAGFVVANVPTPVKEVVYNLVSERFNKDQAGIGANFGNDVQRISIPGVMSLDFDYSLQANERDANFGMILGNYTNVLLTYRSERSLLGDIKEEYVE